MGISGIAMGGKKACQVIAEHQFYQPFFLSCGSKDIKLLPPHSKMGKGLCVLAALLCFGLPVHPPMRPQLGSSPVPVVPAVPSEAAGCRRLHVSSSSRSSGRCHRLQKKSFRELFRSAST